MSNLKIEYVDINTIKPYDKNPRKNDKAAPEIAKSILEFGFKVPILVDENFIIIAGHTRHKAAIILKLSEVPIIRVTDLSPEKIKALRIMDNKSSEFAEWDNEILIKELQELQSEGYNLLNTGFNEEEYLLMVEDLKEDSEPVIEEDFNIEEELNKIEESEIKKGDLYKLGKHYLLCGDSTSQDDFKKLLSASGEMVEPKMVWTDPPYNVNYEDDSGRKILNDNMSSEDFREFLENVFRNLFYFTEDNAAFYICYSSGEHINFESALNKNNIKVRSQIIWVKNSSTFGFAHYKWQHEPILYCAKVKGSLKFYGDRKNTTIWKDLKKEDSFSIELKDGLTLIKVKSGENIYNFSVNSINNVEADSIDNTTVWSAARESNYAHPNQKPVELIRKAFKNSSLIGDVILEPFGGSGSAIITAEQTERICYAMELDPIWCQVIINRHEKLTGIKAEKIG